MVLIASARIRGFGSSVSYDEEALSEPAKQNTREEADSELTLTKVLTAKMTNSG
jgi:hypothetical protein